MDHPHIIMSSLRISLKFVFLGSVILQWYQANGDNAESDIWKSLDNNLESTNEYDLGFTDEEMEGNLKDQVVDNAIGEIDNYHYNEMAYGDIVKDKTLLKRGIEKLQDKNKRRKLKHKTKNLGEEKSNSLMDTIIENPNVVQGHLKDLISRYSEAHKKMHDKININGFKSLAGDAKIINNNSESIDTNKVLTKHNTHRANKDAVIKDEFWNMKTNGSYVVSSMLKNNAKDSNDVTLQSISPNETKNKTNSLSVSNDGESKSKIEKRKKNHKVKDIFENKLEAYAGVESGGKTQSNEEIRRNYVNRLVQINPIGEYNNSKNEHENYANISSINNGFLTAVEKKYFSMNNGALTKFKPKTSIDFGINVNKPENSDSQKNNYRILDRNEIGDIDRIQPSHSSKSKNHSREQFYDVNHKLEKDKNEIKENKVIKENNTLTEGIHVAHSKNNRNLDGHNFHNNKERYEMEDSKQTKTHTFDEKLTLKERNKDSKHHKKPANLLLINYESQHINAKNGEKRNKNRLHRKASALKSNKQLDFLDSGIDIPNIERQETLSKLNSLGNTKDKSKRRNERGIEDVEHKNSKLWKYRMGVDSRGRSRLMISGDKNNNSGSLNEGDESNNKAGNKRSIFRPNNQKQYHASQFNEIPLEEEEDINDMKANDVDDSFDENADKDNNNDTEEYVDVKKVFARRAHHPKYNEDEPRVTDCCVEYKGEKVSGKITRTTTVPIPTTTEKMDSQSCTAKRNNKENTTPKNNKKTQRPKSEDTEATSNNSISDRDMDDYEQFLTGFFADSFVNAVLMKVQKSRKMAKELGFGNYTDESSDRCLETKLSNMPDSETLIKSLNLPKNGQQKYSQICYNRISKSMDDFLLSLISYEKEQESSVYRNIQDESSFIFTGDYPESSVQEEKVFTDDKYNGEKDSIGKDASEKQRLRDDEHEDKDDVQVLNRNNAHSSQNLRHKAGSQEEESVGIVDEHDDNMLKSSIKKRKSKKVVQPTNEIQPSSRDIKFKENDLINEPNVHEIPPSRNKFPEKSFNSNNAKHRRQSYKVENVPRPEIKTGYDIKNHPFKVNGELLDTDKSNLPNGNYRIPNSAGYDSESVQNNRLVYGHPISYQEHRNLAKSDAFPSNANLQENHYVSPNQFYEYPQESWAEREEVNPSIDKDPQYFVSDDVSSNDEEEYQLYPKLNEDNIPRRQMTDYQYHKNIYGKNSRMVKRNTESNYDDDFLFFDLPDIEYDLY